MPSPFRLMPNRVSKLGELVDSHPMERPYQNPHEILKSYPVPSNPPPTPNDNFGGISLPVLDEQPVRQSWWLDPPPGFRPFDYQASINVPAVGVETTVLTFTADIGFGGVIKRIACVFSGSGFIPGSGSLIWRVQINGNPHDGYGAITSSLGTDSVAEGIEGGIIFQPRDVIEVTVLNSLLALVGGITICRLAGYKVPESVIGPSYRG